MQEQLCKERGAVTQRNGERRMNRQAKGLDGAVISGAREKGRERPSGGGDAERKRGYFWLGGV